MSIRNIQFVSGDSKILQVRVRLPDGTPMPVSDIASATYQAARSRGEAAVISKTLGAGITANAEANTLDIALVPADTQDRHGELLHELQIVDTADRTMTAFQGRLTLAADLVA